MIPGTHEGVALMYLATQATPQLQGECQVPDYISREHFTPCNDGGTHDIGNHGETLVGCRGLINSGIPHHSMSETVCATSHDDSQQAKNQHCTKLVWHHMIAYQRVAIHLPLSYCCQYTMDTTLPGDK